MRLQPSAAPIWNWNPAPLLFTAHLWCQRLKFCSPVTATEPHPRLPPYETPPTKSLLLSNLISYAEYSNLCFHHYCSSAFMDSPKAMLCTYMTHPKMNWVKLPWPTCKPKCSDLHFTLLSVFFLFFYKPNLQCFLKGNNSHKTIK